MKKTYKIIRYFNDAGPFFGDGSEIIATGLTLKQAKEHCRDPETSSRTCTSAAGIALTHQRGNWFDGFDEE